MNYLERYAASKQLAHPTVAPSPQHNEIDSTGVRDVDYLGRSGTDGDDRIKLFNPYLPCSALCCFDEVSSRILSNFIPGQDAAPLAEKIV